MGTMASQFTSLNIVYSTVYSGAVQRKHQGFASLAFVRGIYRGPVKSPHIWPVTRKMFPFDLVIINSKSHMAVGILASFHRFYILKRKCTRNCRDLSSHNGYFWHQLIMKIGPVSYMPLYHTSYGIHLVSRRLNNFVDFRSSSLAWRLVGDQIKHGACTFIQQVFHVICTSGIAWSICLQRRVGVRQRIGNTLRPRQNRRHFGDDIFDTFSFRKFVILIKNLL